MTEYTPSGSPNAYTLPDLTALLDGPEAFRDMLDDIDALIVAQDATIATLATITYADGKIAKSLVDAKGDLIVATADNTPARLAVGSNGAVLTAASGETEGVDWVMPSPRVLARVAPAGVASFNFGGAMVGHSLYKVEWRGKSGSAAALLRVRLRAAGVDASGSNYYDYANAPGTYWEFGGLGNLQSVGQLTLACPSDAAPTVFDSRFTQASAAGVFGTSQTGGQHSLSTAYDDLTIYSAGGELITGEFVLLGYGT